MGSIYVAWSLGAVIFAILVLLRLASIDKRMNQTNESLEKIVLILAPKPVEADWSRGAKDLKDFIQVNKNSLVSWRSDYIGIPRHKKHSVL
jgi:hypothetical protein